MITNSGSIRPKGEVDGYTGVLDVNFWYKDTSEQITGLKASDGTSGIVNLSWDSVSAEDVDGYPGMAQRLGSGKIYASKVDNRL